MLHWDALDELSHSLAVHCWLRSTCSNSSKAQLREYTTESISLRGDTIVPLSYVCCVQLESNRLTRPNRIGEARWYNSRASERLGSQCEYSRYR